MSAAPLHHLPADHRLNYDLSDLDRSPRGRTRRSNSNDAASTLGSYDFTGAEDMEIDESSSMRRLQIDDAHAAVGQKRRAASPPAQDHLLHGMPGQGEALRRRDGVSRGSPTPRLAAAPQPSPASSIQPVVPSRSSSFMSTVSMAPSITPANSYGRCSPGGTSPGGVSPNSCNSPFPTPASSTHSPRASVSGRGATHGRAAPGASPRKLTDLQKPGSSKLQGFLMCECCPKKPKKFETAEELR